MSKVLVTGANGFIGSRFVHFLNEKMNNAVICVDVVPIEKRPQPLEGAKFENFFHPDELPEYLRSASAKEIGWVVHMGAISSTTETNWNNLLKHNIELSQYLFSWCAQKQKPLIYASSAATYGAGELGYDDATAPSELQPMNLYGRSKVEFDAWALAQSYQPPHWYGLKFFNVYGPHEEHKGDQASVALKAFHQIAQTGKLKLFRSYQPDFKDGEQKRDFIYVKDVCRGMFEIMEQRPKSDLYNLGSGKARTWLDLGRAAFAALDRPVAIEFIEMPEGLRSHYQYFTEAKMEKWQKQGLSPSAYTLESGIKDYAKYVETSKSS